MIAVLNIILMSFLGQANKVAYQVHNNGMSPHLRGDHPSSSVGFKYRRHLLAAPRAKVTPHESPNMNSVEQEQRREREASQSHQKRDGNHSNGNRARESAARESEVEVERVEERSRDDAPIKRFRIAPGEDYRDKRDLLLEEAEYKAEKLDRAMARAIARDEEPSEEQVLARNTLHNELDNALKIWDRPPVLSRKEMDVMMAELEESERRTRRTRA
eukprot:GHVH01001176.1.p1 GENE.GHVH01001176.1~~GHVH01001176.1.p1  ORF type:complete len:216 (+),score=30.15 GHVH01001176.1:141-788(+)